MIILSSQLTTSRMVTLCPSSLMLCIDAMIVRRNFGTQNKIACLPILFGSVEKLLQPISNLFSVVSLCLLSYLFFHEIVLDLSKVCLMPINSYSVHVRSPWGIYFYSAVVLCWVVGSPCRFQLYKPLQLQPSGL